MARSLMSQAAKTIQRQNSRLRRITENRKAEMSMLRAFAAAGAGGLGAALIDAKWGTAEGPAEVLGVPINAAAGGAMAITALAFDRLPGRIEIGAAGAAMALCAGYKYVTENVEFGE